MDRQAQLFIVARSMLPILGGYDGRLIYGAVCYIIFMVSSLYAIGFVGNVVVPKSIDVGGGGLATIEALIVNVILLALFAIQHSVMARQGFKRWWTQFVPRLVERSTYVLISSLILLLLYWQWRPMTDVIWSVTNPTGATILWVLFWAGWGIVLLSSFLINHFHLFGLQQVYAHWQHVCADLKSHPTPSLLAVAADDRRDLVGYQSHWRDDSVGLVLGRLGHRAAQLVPDQPFPPVWIAAGLCALARKDSAGSEFQDTAVLQMGPASDLFRLPTRFLGNADNDGRTPALRRCDDWLHRNRHAARRTRPHRLPRRCLH
jgi:protein-S-isoprenylcysteine O-methyltransferase Ste14